jgi:tRNA uridine 5-carboxymethylaminomethyl modification enzyme
MKTEEYDVIVVGAGHAGSEAAAASANMGSKTLLITMNLQTIGQMSCNPAMGGVAKGQIVREIDALGGYSGIVSDKSAIQFRMLNRSKGPAMWSPRVQSDRMRFAETWRIMLEETKNVHFFQDMVTGLLVKNDKVVGVRTGLGVEFRAKAVVLTNGTFLNGLIHIGEKQFGGGRAGERAATGITEDLLKMGFESGRMKTGTPPRVDGRSLDYSKMEEQKGDENPEKFSFTDTKPITEQRSCYITYTSDEVHDILRGGFDRSPMFNGAIQSTGPRYCPSIEDKIHRFADRNRHQIFVEPEGWNTVEIYVNGFSTSLPEDVQLEALRKMKGFEKARIFRPGYAIEYDYFPPIQLSHSLQTKLIENLFFAGQINGTTGYEEAGAQGLMAGINAHLKVHGGSPFVLKRSDAYIGVLIDDLITKGTEEPYRMFTSRAEYRILLRQDNADIRLTRLSHDIGLASKEAVARVEEKERQMALASEFVATHNFTPEDINPVLESQKSAPISVKKRINEVLARPQIQIHNLLTLEPLSSFQQAEKISADAWVQTEIHHKYKGYIERERENADKLTRLEDVRIPNELDYHSLQSLSAESREKLARIRPVNIGQAKRISGVSPSDIQVLLVYLGR